LPWQLFKHDLTGLLRPVHFVKVPGVNPLHPQSGFNIEYKQRIMKKIRTNFRIIIILKI
jgi:hypothetical protein